MQYHKPICYSITISIANVTDKLNSLVPPVQTFTTKTCHPTFTGLNHPHFLHIHSRQLFPPQDVALFGIDTCVCAFHSFLISSNQGQIISHPHYPRNFLPPSLPIMSHTSFIIIILAVTHYLEWLSWTLYLAKFSEKQKMKVSPRVRLDNNNKFEYCCHFWAEVVQSAISRPL